MNERRKKVTAGRKAGRQEGKKGIPLSHRSPVSACARGPPSVVVVSSQYSPYSSSSQNK
jgi:hypothetical protein